MSQNNNKFRIGIFIVLSLILSVITFYTAWNSGFTHDESFTFNNYVPASTKEIITYEIPTANNHMLNSLLMKLFSKISGNSELSLRFPNLIAHLFYILFSFLLVSKLNKYIQIPFFILLNFNPFLLEYFSMARGYGLSIAFMMGSFYFFTRYEDNRSGRSFFYSNILACFAVLSNFTLLNYFIALYALFIIISIAGILRSKNKILYAIHLIKINIWSFIVTVISVFTVYVSLQKLINHNQLYFGGEGTFWDVIVMNIIYCFINIAHYSFDAEIFAAFSWFTALLISANVLLGSIWIIRKKFTLIGKHKLLFVVNGILLIISCMLIFNHHFFGTKYIIQRTALFLYPLFILNFAYLTDAISDYAKKKVLISIPLYILGFFVLLHNFFNINLSRHIDIPYDEHVKEMITALKADADQRHLTKPVSLGINWQFEPTVNFYRTTLHLDWILPVNRDGLNDSNDYYFVMEEDLPGLKDYKNNIVKGFEDNSTYVLINKK